MLSLTPRIFAGLKGTRFHLLGSMFALLLTAQLASAFTETTGQVGAVEIVGSGASAPGNYDFRVYLVGTPIICNGEPWVYINTNDANYNALVASILTAKSLGSTVNFFWTQASNGFCQLDYIVVN